MDVGTQANPKTAESGWIFQRSDVTKPGSGRSLEDRRLADGWFYADAVHADRAGNRHAAEFSVSQRFRAAYPMVARLALATLHTKDLIDDAEADGIISINRTAREEEVVVDLIRPRSEVRAGCSFFRPDYRCRIRINRLMGPDQVDLFAPPELPRT